MPTATKPTLARYAVRVSVRELDPDEPDDTANGVRDGLCVEQVVKDGAGFVDALAQPLRTANLIAARLDKGPPEKPPEKKAAKPGRK